MIHSRSMIGNGVFALVCLAAAAAMFLGGCEDNFECGVETGEGAIRSCVGKSEVCVCATNRCAVYDAGCETKYRYVYGTSIGKSIEGENCIKIDDIEDLYKVGGLIHEGIACPLEPPVCGIAGDDDQPVECASGERCLCQEEGGVCVREDAECLSEGAICINEDGVCANSGYRATFAWECIETQQESLVFADDETRLCP